MKQISIISNGGHSIMVLYSVQCSVVHKHDSVYDCGLPNIVFSFKVWVSVHFSLRTPFFSFHARNPLVSGRSKIRLISKQVIHQEDDNLKNLIILTDDRTNLGLKETLS